VPPLCTRAILCCISTCWKPWVSAHSITLTDPRQASGPFRGGLCSGLHHIPGRAGASLRALASSSSAPHTGCTVRADRIFAARSSQTLHTRRARSCPMRTHCPRTCSARAATAGGACRSAAHSRARSSVARPASCARSSRSTRRGCAPTARARWPATGAAHAPAPDPLGGTVWYLTHGRRAARKASQGSGAQWRRVAAGGGRIAPWRRAAGVRCTGWLGRVAHVCVLLARTCSDPVS